MEDLRTEKEFTFQQLFALLKKSALRILIFCLAAGFVMGVISVSVYLGTGDANATVHAVVNYRYKGVEKGLDPLGNDLNPYLISSPAVVYAALDALDKKGTTISFSKQNDIINNLDVSGMIPENLSAESLATYIPTSYKLTLENIKKLGLSRTVALKLVNEITAQYEIYFREMYKVPTYIPHEVIFYNYIAKDIDITYDYVELYDIYRSEILAAISYLNARSTEAPDFRYSETGRTFTDLTTVLRQILNNDLVKYESFVVNNGLSTDREALLNYLDSRVEILNSRLTRAESDVISLQEALAKEGYQIGEIIYYVTQDGNPIIASGGPTAQYDKMYADLITTSKEVNSINEELEILQLRRDKFETSSTPLSSDKYIEADARATDLAYRVNNIINEANESATEYYNTKYLQTAVGAPAGAIYLSNRSLTPWLLASAVVVVLAAVSAVIVTQVRTKKKG